MELSEFVYGTLKQILDGIQSAQEYAKKVGAVVNPQARPAANPSQWFDPDSQTFVQSVEFDIAVTETSGKNTQGGLGASIGIFAVGTVGKSDKEESSSNRLRFTVPIVYPPQKRG